MTPTNNLEEQIVALTKGVNESSEAAYARVRRALEFADVTKFEGENGDLDAGRIERFANALGGGVSAPAGGSGDSVQVVRERVAERLAKFGVHA